VKIVLKIQRSCPVSVPEYVWVCCDLNKEKSSWTLVGVEQLYSNIHRRVTCQSSMAIGTPIKTTMVPPNNKLCTQNQISEMRGCEKSRFWRLCRHYRESETNRSWLPLDWCIMSRANSIAWGSSEKIDELFSRRLLHNRDSTMAAAPTASPILELSVKMRVWILRQKFVDVWLENSKRNLWLVSM